MNNENNINYSEGFKYPEEGEVVERVYDVSSTDIIVRLSTILFSAKKPKIVLAALLYGSGIDVGIYLSVDNTEKAIATALGISQQSFHYTILKMCKEFNIEHVNTGKNPESRINYKNNNQRLK